jgi:DNA-binding beta-propeller fold protein YncE
LREPCAVAARGEDLYVADTWNGRVQHYTIRGEYRGTASGLYGPRGVTVADDGSVWVTDTGNHRVAQYDVSLVLKRMLGKSGSGRADLSSPVGIAAAPDGRVWIADAGNRRLQVVGPSGFERAVAFPGWSAPGQEPHLAFGNGVLYATDPADNALFAIRPDGSIARRWVKDDRAMDLSRPTGVAVDRERAILYVVNSAANSVSKITDAERKTGR